MKKRGMALVLALLLLAGCAPEAEMPPPPSTSAETEPCGVYTDWSKLTPYVPEDRESLYYCSAVGPHGIVALEDTGECVLISPEGEEVWRTPGKEAWFWDNFWSGDTAIFWDGEDTRLMDTHTGQSYGLDGARDPQGFHEGLARAHDEADKWGYIDGAGRWVIPPAYDQCGDFENGRAVAVREGTHSLIDRQGRTLLDAAWQLRACRGLDGENWYLDYVETEDYGCQVWAAYDEDGNQLDAPAEGTVLRVGIYGRMYETREDATVLWLGGAPVVLPLAGELGGRGGGLRCARQRRGD